ncbi:MAG: alpha-amylase family glycosyl hydrolase [Chloroflexota bacterium]|nr:MAG: alpha-amylase [Chloroflexota bacterium]
MGQEFSLWWQTGVIYQIYPRSFQDTNGDGIGDIPGITSRLDYLADTLRVDAIWLSPFYPSPMADFGYDVSNYVDVDPVFGTLGSFDEMLQGAHDRGLKVIVDWVPNHSSDQHPWFLESRSSRDSLKREWYVWRDAKPDGSPPNNWLSWFGGGAWEWDETTGQYYLHSFLKEQPDLNWRNPEVKRTMHDVLRFWLDRGVDGVRIDVANMILKDPELRDNPPNPEPAATSGHARAYWSQVHLYDKSHPDVHDAFREIRGVLDDYGTSAPRMAVGEMFESDRRASASYYGNNLDELHMPFNFALISAPWTAQAVRNVVDITEAIVPAGGWPNYVLGNHDQHRLASRIGAEQARVGMTLLLTLRGTPTMYYGDELGMHDVPITLEQVHDPWELNEPGLGRDAERTPMQWNTQPNAGFCALDVQPWLPIAGDYREINVAVEREEQSSTISLTRSLLELRRAHPCLAVGSYRPVDDGPESCFVYLREHEQHRCLVALNFSAESQTVALQKRERGSILVSTHLDRVEEVDLSRLHLRPNEGCVIEVGRR